MHDFLTKHIEAFQSLLQADSQKIYSLYYFQKKKHVHNRALRQKHARQRRTSEFRKERPTKVNNLLFGHKNTKAT